MPWRRFDLSARDGSGKTALHIAALNNNFGIVDALHRTAGADLFATDDQGRTPRQLCEDALSPVTKCLLRFERQFLAKRSREVHDSQLYAEASAADTV